MKRNVLSLVLIFVSCVVLSAQTSVWKVSKGGSEIYLAGTIHLLRPADLPLPAPFFAALEQSDVLYVEADVDKMQDQQVAQQMMMKMMLPQGETLSSVLEEETYKRLEEACTSVGIPLAQLAAFKPALAVVSLTSMKLMGMGITGEGVDKTLMKKAAELKKEVAFMESVEYQIDVISKMGEGNEDAFVRYSLDDLDKVEVEFSALLDEWKVGENEKMNASVEEMQQDFPKLYTSLLLERNKNWMEKIKPLFENDKTEMIAVGTLHLHGEDGLLSQLKAKGYKVKHVK